MLTLQTVNEEGYKALINLVKRDPALFTTPEPQRLIEEVVKAAGTDAVWREELTLNADLGELNSWPSWSRNRCTSRQGTTLSAWWYHTAESG